MALFNNASSSPSSVPLSKVLELRSQGNSDHAIIDDLQKAGYSSMDIFEALTQADANTGTVTNIPPSVDQNWGSIPSNGESQPAPQSQPPMQQNMQSPPAQYYAPTTPPPPPPMAPAPSQNTPVWNTPSPSHGSSITDADIHRIDEIAEAIIDEKWGEMRRYIEKIVDWKGKVETRILRLESEMEAYRKDVATLQSSLMEKVQGYDRHITDVATEIKAMEKVFQKIVPTLTENVNELSHIVTKMQDKDKPDRL